MSSNWPAWPLVWAGPQDWHLPLDLQAAGWARVSGVTDREFGLSLKLFSLLPGASDDGTGPEKIAHIMGPPDRCEHAARIINDLLQSLRVGGPGASGWAVEPRARPIP